MVEVAAFKGMMYNKEKIPKLDDVMSPPYDIISEEMQNILYNKHPYNFVKLILGKQFPSDTEKNNRYTRAQQTLQEWKKNTILITTEKEAIYPYQIQYTVQNKKRTMHGFFILLKLDPTYTTVKAHEKTLAKPKADRLNLMRSCNAHLEPIQLLYLDDNNHLQNHIEKMLKNKQPEINVTGYDGFTHQLWSLDEPAAYQKIIDHLKNEVLFIADGHHRYQTAINFAQEQQQKTGNTDRNAPFNYQMVILMNMFDAGLMILPTHRLIKMPNLDIAPIRKKLEQYFSITEHPRNPKLDYEAQGEAILDLIKSTTNHVFALYSKKTIYVLTLKDKTIMDKFASEHSAMWRTLDVSILHKIILEHSMGITDANLEDYIKYTRSAGEAIHVVDEKKYDASILMNATKIEQLKAIAEGGEHMPQKSTYFLPKMLSGLVMYSFE